MSGRSTLTFEALDDLAFAAELGRLGANNDNLKFETENLGPFIEFLQLLNSGLFNRSVILSWLALNNFTSFYQVLTTNRLFWICPQSQALGFFRLSEVLPQDNTSWIQFGLAMQKAAESMGFSKLISKQFVGAIGELHSNIYEHSGASKTGIIAYRGQQNLFEFVISDLGMGVLKSLNSCSEYKNLTDGGEALRLVLQEKVSRYGTHANRGMGFRPLFQGLANLNGFLRFRSEDHALTLNGQNPGVLPAKIAQKPKISGFFISVSCMNVA